MKLFEKGSKKLLIRIEVSLAFIYFFALIGLLLEVKNIIPIIISYFLYWFFLIDLGDWLLPAFFIYYILLFSIPIASLVVYNKKYIIIDLIFTVIIITTFVSFTYLMSGSSV